MEHLSVLSGLQIIQPFACLRGSNLICKVSVWLFILNNQEHQEDLIQLVKSACLDFFHQVCTCFAGMKTTGSIKIPMMWYFP